MSGEPNFTEVQKKMLTAAFYIDGNHNIAFLPEAQELVTLGLLTMREGGDSQYTSYHFEPVSAP